jgi:hypothetical protein
MIYFQVRAILIDVKYFILTVVKRELVTLGLILKRQQEAGYSTTSKPKSPYKEAMEATVTRTHVPTCKYKY